MNTRDEITRVSKVYSIWSIPNLRRIYARYHTRESIIAVKRDLYDRMVSLMKGNAEHESKSYQRRSL